MAIERSVRRAALGALAVGFLAGAIYLWQRGAATPASVRDWLLGLGTWAHVLFVGAMALGALLGMPGMAFVVAGRLVFGPWLGFALGCLGGMAAVLVPFVAARGLRPRRGPPWRPRHPLLARAFAQLETHPVRAVMILRLVLWFNPPLSYALAFAPVRLRDYAIGCALALAPVVAAAMLATGWFA